MADRNGLSVVGEGGLGVSVSKLEGDFSPGQELYVEGVTDNVGGPVVCQGQFCAWVEPQKVARIVFVHLSVADSTKFADVPIERLKPVPPEIAENRRLAYEHGLRLNPDGTIAWDYLPEAAECAQACFDRKGEMPSDFRLKLLAHALQDFGDSWFIENPAPKRPNEA